MKQSIQLKRLTAGSLFKFLAVGIFPSLVLFSMLMGVFAIFGADTVKWNGQPIKGVIGFIASPFVGIFISILFTCFAWLGFQISFLLFSIFGSLKIHFVPSSVSPKAEQGAAANP